MHDPYAGNEGLNDLIQQAADKTIEFIEGKRDAVARANEATSRYIAELRRAEEAKNCMQAWEKHTVQVLNSAMPIALTAEEMPRIAQQHDDYSKIAQGLIDDRHPFMKRIA